jgi:hypothetical protein
MNILSNVLCREVLHVWRMNNLSWEVFLGLTRSVGLLLLYHLFTRPVFVSARSDHDGVCGAAIAPLAPTLESFGASTNHIIDDPSRLTLSFGTFTARCALFHDFHLQHKNMETPAPTTL